MYGGSQTLKSETPLKERNHLKHTYVAKPVTVPNIYLVAECTSLKETTQIKFWQRIAKVSAFWNVTKFLLERNLMIPVISFVKNVYFCGCTQVTQLCPAICSPVDCRPPGFFGFPRQEFWSGLLYPPLGDLPNLGIESRSPALQADLYHPRHQGSSLKTTECIKRFRGCVCV